MKISHDIDLSVNFRKPVDVRKTELLVERGKECECTRRKHKVLRRVTNDFHRGQTIGHTLRHARDLQTSGDFRSLASFITQNFHGQPPTLESSRARY